MIDTVRLTIPNEQFVIVNPERFDPPANDVSGYTVFGAHGSKKWVQNLRKRAGHYMPKLTIMKRLVSGGKSVTLNVECSLPKLIFDGNNFDELEDNDFAKVVRILHERVEAMGIRLVGNPIEEAIISAIHFSKNIAFLDYTTVSSVLKYLEKADLTRKLDLNTKRFDNGGAALYFFSKNHALVFYDKMRDLNRPKGRGVEDNAFHLQGELFDDVDIARQHPLEMLRIEFRLNNRRKLESFLRKIGEPNPTTFRKFFNSRLSQKVLQHCWQATMDSCRSFILAESMTPQEIIREFLNQRLRKARPSAALQVLGCYYGAKELGIRSLEDMFNKYFSPGSIQRYIAQMNGLEFKQSHKFEPFNHISKALSEFKPLKMKDLTLPF